MSVDAVWLQSLTERCPHNNQFAIKRAKELGMPVPDVPPTANGRGPKVVNDAGPCFKAAIGFSGPVQ
jgi:hypothetical protein